MTIATSVWRVAADDRRTCTSFTVPVRPWHSWGGGVGDADLEQYDELSKKKNNCEILGTGYFLVAREAFRLLRRQGRGGGLDRLHRLQERARGGQERGRDSSAKRRPSSTSPPPGRGGRERRHPGQHRQPGRRAPGLPHLGLVVARGARRGVRHRARGAGGALPAAHDARCQHLPGRTSRRRCCTSPPKPARARARATCSTSTAACPAPTPADDLREQRQLRWVRK